jgi:WD40 repeat protein
MDDDRIKVFISYSHEGQEHASRVLDLADRLRRDGVDASIDQYEAAPAEGWPHWMVRQIREADFVIMVCTEAYFRRVMGEEKPGIGRGVRWEGHLILNQLYDAKAAGKKFVPVVFTENDQRFVPDPVQAFPRYDVSAHRGYEDLYRRLTDQPGVTRPELGTLRELPHREREWKERPKGKLNNVPKEPVHYLPRLGELKSLKSKVLDKLTAAEVQRNPLPPIGVEGMGGIGKSVLVAALARDDEIQEAFQDGIYWIWLGQHKDNMAAERFIATRLADLIELVSGERPGIADLEQGQMRLEGALREKICLVIVDDVWDANHIRWFNVLGNRGRLVFTTRDRGIVEKLGAIEHEVGEFSPSDALALLKKASDCDTLPETAKEIVEVCGRLPLALALAGGMIRGDASAWETVYKGLVDADWDRIRANFPEYPYASVFAAIEASVVALEGDKERYFDLAIFPEDTLIPEKVLTVLWRPLGLNDLDVLQLIQTFSDRCLASRDGEGHITLHDLQDRYVRQRADNIEARHHRLTEGYRDICGGSWDKGPKDDRYFFELLPWHLKQAGAEEELRNLLYDYRWLQTKLEIMDVRSLPWDFGLLIAEDAIEKGDQARKVQGALRLSAFVLAKDKKQLAGQLLGRLDPRDGDDIASLLKDARALVGKPALLPKSASLTPPGSSQLLTIDAHSRAVTALAVLPGGEHVLSSARDKTIRLWELATGDEVRSFTGHEDWVTCLTIAPDGRTAISGSDDRTIRHWDLGSGRQMLRISGHDRAVTAVAMTQDKRYVVSASEDGTIRIWDLSTEKQVDVIGRNDKRIWALALCPDGRTLVTGDDDDVRIWDIKSRAVLGGLEGHSRAVTCISTSPDGRKAVSGSRDGSICVWDLEKRTLLRTLLGHEGKVFAVAVHPDGTSVLSGSDDGTMRIWNLEVEEEPQRFEGHTLAVTAVAPVGDAGSQAVSGSVDGKIILWNVEKTIEPQRRTGHRDIWIRALTVTPDDQFLAIARGDHNIHVLDFLTGDERRTLSGHESFINFVVALPDGHHILSTAGDNSIRLWNIRSGELVRPYYHDQPINCVAILPDERHAIAASADSTLFQWNLESGAMVRRYEGHQGPVNSVAVLPGGNFAISGSADRKICFWNLDESKPMYQFDGHESYVNCVVVTPNGRYAVSASDDQTCRVWDLARRQPVRTLKGHTLRVNVAAVTTNNRYVLSVSDDQTCRLWDIESGASRATFSCDVGISRCVMTANPNRAAIGDVLGRIHHLEISEDIVN